MRRSGWIIGGLVFAVVIALQINQMAQFRAELATLRAELRGAELRGAEEAEAPEAASQGGSIARPTIDRSAGLSSRLANLERVVADLTKASQTLMERGMVPASEQHLAELQNRFFDPAASEADRLRSLRLLKRNNRQLSDEIVTHAMSMLQSSTNGNTRRALLPEAVERTNALPRAVTVKCAPSKFTRSSPPSRAE